MPAPNSRRNTSHQNSTITTVGRRLAVGSEEGGEEPRLEQQHLPAEPVERLPDARDRHVAEPEQQEAEHRHPRRARAAGCRRPARGQRRCPRRRARQGADPCTADGGTRWDAASGPLAWRSAPTRAARGAGSSPCSPSSARNWFSVETNAMMKSAAMPALQHLPSELEVDRREPVHRSRPEQVREFEAQAVRCRAAPDARRTSPACR